MSEMKEQSPIWGFLAETYERKSRGGLKIDFPNSYFKNPPTVVLQIQAPEMTTGYIENLLSVSTGSFNTDTINTFAAGFRYTVYWIAYGIIGYQAASDE